MRPAVPCVVFEQLLARSHFTCLTFIVVLHVQSPHYPLITPKACTQSNFARWHSHPHHWERSGPWWSFLRKMYSWRATFYNGSGQLDQSSLSAKVGDGNQKNDLMKALSKLQATKQSLDAVHDIVQDPNLNYFQWGHLILRLSNITVSYLFR